jgi:hypothetical protein
MSYTSSGDTRTVSHVDVEQRLRRLQRVAELLDTAVGIPGTRFRFGFDSIVGLIPGIGDSATALVSLWLVYEAHKLGLPRAKLLRMLGNVGVDAAVGSVPLLGDVFDLFWKSNRRNWHIIADHFGRR